ncbi:MAG: hypothetical protein WC317_06345 [Candidatus Omnitrophota bacterium]|jgi:asparagine N-glycosylation enzyme membrane subunit Stt3
MKKNLVIKSIPVILFAAFLVGFFGKDMEGILYSWLCAGLVFIVSIALTINAIANKKMGIVIAILFIVFILLPFSVLGSCGLTYLGALTKTIFIK